MKSESNFWHSLERYVWRVVRKSPLPWQWIGIGLLVIVLLASALNTQNSIVRAKNMSEAIELAVSRGDYQTAQELFNLKSQITNSQMILGAETELEDKVYPERVVEKKIGELEERLKIYPGNREIYLVLADLYQTLDSLEISGEYREKARILDPNNVNF